MRQSVRRVSFGFKRGKDSQRRGGRYKSSISHDVLLAEIRQVCRTDVSQEDGIVRKILQDVMPINANVAPRCLHVFYPSYVTPSS